MTKSKKLFQTINQKEHEKSIILIESLLLDAGFRSITKDYDQYKEIESIKFSSGEAVYCIKSDNKIAYESFLSENQNSTLDKAQTQGTRLVWKYFSDILHSQIMLGKLRQNKLTEAFFSPFILAEAGTETKELTKTSGKKNNPQTNA